MVISDFIMIKFSEFLAEEFAKYIKSPFAGRSDFPVYLNPTKDDLIELLKLKIRKTRDVRFIIDIDNDNLYVFDDDAAWHKIVIDRLPELSSNIATSTTVIKKNFKLSDRYGFGALSRDVVSPKIKSYFERG